jgi:hypothetical protein
VLQRGIMCMKLPMDNYMFKQLFLYTMHVIVVSTSHNEPLVKNQLGGSPKNNLINFKKPMEEKKLRLFCTYTCVLIYTMKPQSFADYP